MSRPKAFIGAGFALLALLAVATQPAGLAHDIVREQAAWAALASVAICTAAALLCRLASARFATREAEQMFPYCSAFRLGADSTECRTPRLTMTP